MYNIIGFQNIVNFINNLWMKKILHATLCVLFIYSPCFAGGVRTKTIINPLWEGRLNLRPSAGAETKQKQGSFQSVQNTVSSYDEFKLALIKGMKERQSPITIYFNPSRSYSEVQQWNDSFWGTSSTPSPKESDLFHDVPWLIYDWTDLNWNWFSDAQNFVTKLTYDITFDYDAVKEKELETGLLTTLQQIISPDMDIATIEKTIHDWIVNHVDYDNATLTGNDDMGYTDYSAFIRGLAVCGGYSRLTSRMLFMAGISNLIAVGNVTSSADSHAWNMVKLDNDWYQLDVTWDDYGLYGDYTIYYDYYNITDNKMSVDHIWDKTAYPQAVQIFDAGKYQGMIENDQCSVFRPYLCSSEIDCIKINGTWNGSYCTINQSPDKPPVIDSFTSDITSGFVSLNVVFICQAHDTGGTIIAYQWDFNNDGIIDQTTADNSVDHTYTSIGTYQAVCYAVDNVGQKVSTGLIKITVNDNINLTCPVTQSCLNFELINCNSSNNCKESNIFYKDNKLQLKLNINPQSSDPLKQVDLYVGILSPDGTLWFLTSDPSNPVAVWNGGVISPDMAYRQNIKQSGQSLALLNFTVNQGLSGIYTVYALFEGAGESLDLSSLLSNLAYMQIIFK